MRQLTARARGCSGFLRQRLRAGKTDQNAAAQQFQEDAPVEIEPVHSAFYLMLRELKCERRIEVMGIEIIGHRLIYSALPLPRALPPQ